MSARRVMTAGLAGALLCAGVSASAQTLPRRPARPAAASMPAPAGAQRKLDHYPVRGGVHMFSGPRGNITVFVGKDGVAVIDPGSTDTAAELLAEITRLSPDKPIRWVIDTNANPDHAGANARVAAAGLLLEGGNARPKEAVGDTGAPIWAHEGTLNRLAAANDPGIPSNSFFVASKDMWVNGEAVQLLNASPGTEEGDAFVYLRGSEVIVAGDIFTPSRYPQIDLAHGGTIQGVIDGLNMLLRYAIPEFNAEGGTLIIPGHGRISDEADVGLYRDMVTIVRDRVRDMIGRKMTLAQVQAARPTLDYDPYYGAAAGHVFVEAVYRSLTEKASAEGSAQ